MRRTIATLGVVGVGLMSVTVAANAAPPEDKKITICHATSAAGNPFIVETINLSALKAHANDTLDIVPMNSGDVMPQGQNLTQANLAVLANGCAPAVVVPPVDPPTDPGSGPTDPATNPATDTSAGPTDPATDPSAGPTDPATDPGSGPTDPATDPSAGPTDPVKDPVTPTAVTPLVVEGKAVTPVKKASAAGKIVAVVEPAKVNVGYNVQTAVGHAPTPEGLPVWLLGLTGMLAAGSGAVLWRGSVRARNAAG